MAKRFCDTDLWKNQRWFRKLPPNFKLVFCYIRDECNHAGLWKIDCTDLIEDLGIDCFSMENFISSVNTEYDPLTGAKFPKERLRIIKNNFLWITGFIQFQYEGKGKKVTPTAPYVRTALDFLDGLGVLNEALQKGYITLTEPLQDGWQTVQYKYKSKDSINSLTKKSENGKKSGSSRSFRVQQEDLLADAISTAREKADKNRTQDSSG